MVVGDVEVCVEVATTARVGDLVGAVKRQLRLGPDVTVGFLGWPIEPISEPESFTKFVVR